MGGTPNPYNWQSHNPRVEIPIAEVERLVGTLREGGSAVVLGGRGMGKSVTLHQVRRALERDEDTRVVLISAPPPEITVRACLEELAEILGVAPEARSSRILEAYFARKEAPERLVLLYDEFDRYTEKGEASTQPPGRGFFNDLEAARRDLPGLGLMAAGSLGVFVVRDILGSSFLSRALHVRLRPLGRDTVDVLAHPFDESGNPLADEICDVLHLATGGIPALVTYGLQKLWTRTGPVHENDVTTVYAAFSRDHAAYLQDVLRSVTDPRLSEAPLRVLEAIRQATGPLSRAQLEQAMQSPAGPLALELIDVLQLLEAAGLVHIEGSLFHDNPVRVRPIASLLNLPASSGRGSKDLGEQLHQDLEALLGKLHRASADFFRPGRDGTRKQLVPESVFTAHLALGLELLGWRVERESQSAAGRTDLKLQRNGAPEVLLVEVKIWGRNQYRAAQAQVESYWTEEVCTAAIVQLTDADIEDWSERYAKECLGDPGLMVEIRQTPDSPLSTRFTVESAVGNMATRIDHILLRLPRNYAC